jgi:hypothetical protein
MVVRLFVVVLTLVGAVPIRVCTCGAAHEHASSSPREVQRELPHGVVPDPAHEHHDADCHAVNPRPLMSAGLQVVVTDAPAPDALAVPFADDDSPAPSAGHADRQCHPPPNRPPHLAYTVLRI